MGVRDRRLVFSRRGLGLDFGRKSGFGVGSGLSGLVLRVGTVLTSGGNDSRLVRCPCIASDLYLSYASLSDRMRTGHGLET
jgi:hypothetical protein